jgi:hypothetical protein
MEPDWSGAAGTTLVALTPVQMSSVTTVDCESAMEREASTSIVGAPVLLALMLVGHGRRPGIRRSRAGRHSRSSRRLTADPVIPCTITEVITPTAVIQNTSRSSAGDREPWPITNAA